MKLKQKIVNLLSHFESVRITFFDNFDGLASSRRNLILGSFCGTSFSNLVGGIFFTSLILLMLEGTDTVTQNNFLGTVSMMGFALGLTQLIAPLIMERFPKRKKLLLILRAFYHLLNIVLIGFVPILPVSSLAKRWIFMIIYVIFSLITQISASAFSVWHVGDLPNRVRANYFSIVNMVSPIISSVIATSASFFIDIATAGGWKFWGLMILRVPALLFAILEIIAFSKIEEPDYEPAPKINPIKMMTLPFTTPRYLLTVLIVCIYSFGANFTGQYFTAYILEDVKLSYALISGLSILNIPISLLVYPIWSKVIGRLSWMKTLSIATILYMTPYILNFLTTADAWVLFVISNITAFLFGPGITLVFSNIPYMNIPATNQTSYISFYSTCNNLAAFLGSTVCRFFVEAMGTNTFNILGSTFQVRQVINLLPCCTLILTSLTAMVVERSNKKRELLEAKG